MFKKQQGVDKVKNQQKNKTHSRTDLGHSENDWTNHTNDYYMAYNPKKNASRHTYSSVAEQATSLSDFLL